jgi:hypothetical protein
MKKPSLFNVVLLGPFLHHSLLLGLLCSLLSFGQSGVEFRLQRGQLALNFLQRCHLMIERESHLGTRC